MLLGGIAAVLARPFGARAQGLSNRPVRIILGQTAATTPDLLARTIAPRMQAKWNQPFVVENRGGAGGAIGLDAVAKAPPDGHTITISVNSTLTLPLFFKIDFDVLTSFTPISVVASSSSGSPAKAAASPADFGRSSCSRSADTASSSTALPRTRRRTSREPNATR